MGGAFYEVICYKPFHSTYFALFVEKTDLRDLVFLTIRFLFENMSSPSTILPCNRTIRNGFGQQAVYY